MIKQTLLLLSGVILTIGLAMPFSRAEDVIDSAAVAEVDASAPADFTAEKPQEAVAVDAGSSVDVNADLGTDTGVETGVDMSSSEGDVVAQSQATPQGNGNAKGEKKKTSWQDIPSVLFTFWESAAVQEAYNSRGLARPPSEAELAKDLNLPPSAITEPKAKVKPPPEAREIKLSGIAYKSEKNWTIWLNGQRVTPNAIPPEILDLQVERTYIEIKWFDEYTNRILPIRLRPHQRFNMDTRIFLPG